MTDLDRVIIVIAAPLLLTAIVLVAALVFLRPPRPPRARWPQPEPRGRHRKTDGN